MKHLLSALFLPVLLISGAPQLAAEPAVFDELAMASELDSGLQPITMGIRRCCGNSVASSNCTSPSKGS